MENAQPHQNCAKIISNHWREAADKMTKPDISQRHNALRAPKEEKTNRQNENCI